MHNIKKHKKYTFYDKLRFIFSYRLNKELCFPIRIFRLIFGIFNIILPWKGKKNNYPLRPSYGLYFSNKINDLYIILYWNKKVKIIYIPLKYNSYILMKDKSWKIYNRRYSIDRNKKWNKLIKYKTITSDNNIIDIDVIYNIKKQIYYKKIGKLKIGIKITKYLLIGVNNKKNISTTDPNWVYPSYYTECKIKKTYLSTIKDFEKEHGLYSPIRDRKNKIKQILNKKLYNKNNH